MRRKKNLENDEFKLLLIHFLSFLKVATPVVNSCALGRFHSLDLNQQIGYLGRFLSSGFKLNLQSPPTVHEKEFNSLLWAH